MPPDSEVIEDKLAERLQVQNVWRHGIRLPKQCIAIGELGRYWTELCVVDLKPMEGRTQ
jgi:hypothetical protein